MEVLLSDAEELTLNGVASVGELSAAATEDGDKGGGHDRYQRALASLVDADEGSGESGGNGGREVDSGFLRKYDFEPDFRRFVPVLGVEGKVDYGNELGGDSYVSLVNGLDIGLDNMAVALDFEVVVDEQVG